MHLQRLHADDVMSTSLPNEHLFFPSCTPAGSRRDVVDIKPTMTELASLAVHSPPLPRDHHHHHHDAGGLVVRHRSRAWRDVRRGGLSAGPEFPPSAFPPPSFGRESVGRSVDDVFTRQQQFSRDVDPEPPGVFHRRQHPYQPPTSDRYPADCYPPSANYGFPVAELSCESPVSVAFSSPGSGGTSQDVCPPEFARPPPTAETAAPRCRFMDAGLAPQRPPSAGLQFQTEPGSSDTYQQPLCHHHPLYSERTAAAQLPGCFDGRQSAYGRGDGAAPAEFAASEADMAVQRLPAALKLISDLQRNDTGLRESVDQLRCSADDVLEQLRNSVVGDRHREFGGASPKLDSASITRQIVVVACQLCDQALFVLVEWARHAHFFCQLSVNTTRHNTVIIIIIIRRTAWTS